MSNDHAGLKEKTADVVLDMAIGLARKSSERSDNEGFLARQLLRVVEALSTPVMTGAAPFDQVLGAIADRMGAHTISQSHAAAWDTFLALLRKVKESECSFRPAGHDDTKRIGMARLHDLLCPFCATALWPFHNVGPIVGPIELVFEVDDPIVRIKVCRPDGRPINDLFHQCHERRLRHE